jgi:hypothetical protein
MPKPADLSVTGLRQRTRSHPPARRSSRTIAAWAPEPVSRLPDWAAGIVALVCIVGRVVLIFRPFTSVEVLMLLAALSAVRTGGKAS